MSDFGIDLGLLSLGRFFRRFIVPAGIAMVLAGAAPFGAALAQGSGMPLPRFDDNCTQSNRTILLEATNNVSKLIDESVIAIEFMHDTDAYRESFGAYDKARHAEIRRRLNAIHEGTRAIRIEARCEPPGQSRTCDAGAWAYISKQSKELGTDKDYVINFCPSYFDATDELVRSYNQWSYAQTMRGAVFLHELTHFNWPLPGGGGKTLDGGETHTMIAGTVDNRYDEGAVKRLAAKKPEKAVGNADSYHVFMMKLNTMNRIMYR